MWADQQSARAGIALGSNLGDRLGHLRQARDLLRPLAVAATPFLQAPVYRTAPVACPAGSPDFFNTVVEFAFAGDARELLAATQAIEEILGRRKVEARNAPRVIDLDLLYLGNLREQDGRLELPHPRLAARRFVLQPLAEIRPDLVLPGHRATVADQLAGLDSDEPPLVVVRHRW